MKILNILSVILDIFEINRKTTTEEIQNKEHKRMYNFKDGNELPPLGKKEYELQKKMKKEDNSFER